MARRYTAMNRQEWLAYGRQNGYCGPRVCITHDGYPTTAAEDAEIGEYDDPCIFLLRVYRDELERAAVEENHSPSVWRNE